LRRQLESAFNLAELQELCFALAVDYENLGEGGKSQKIIALLYLLARAEQLPQLIALCQQERPSLDWTPFAEAIATNPEQFLPKPGERPSGDILISGGDFRGAVINIQSTIVGTAEVKEIESLPPEPGEPPYKGLQFFDEADADRFVGREQLTARLVGRLHQLRFLAVIGASGSGKSSLVRAGVLPALRRGTRLADGALPPAESGQWGIYLFTPTAHPLEALAATLMRESESVTAVTTLQQELSANPRTLALTARQLLARQGRKHLLLVIDQFEEIFTLCRQPEERQAFIDNLVASVPPDDPQPLTIVITLRADFYAQCAQYEGLRQLVSQQQEYIGAMNRDELFRIIVQPAALGDWRLQEGLVELMLDDVGDEPGALPLLAHALLETWARRRGRTLTLSAYKEAGGVRGAIAQTAETLFQQRLNQAQQAVARAIFIRLTELGETLADGETATPDTRRRVQFSELITRAADPQILDAVLSLLVDARLVTTDLIPPQETKVVEVAHEALIREWPTLRRWLNENREGLLRHRQLTDAVNEWLKDGRDPGYLFRGARLRQTLAWIDAAPDPLSLDELEFIEASRAAAEEEEKRARQLANARQRQRLLVGVAAVLLLAVMLFVANLLGAFNAFREPGQMSGTFNIAVAEMAVTGDVSAETTQQLSERIAANLTAGFDDTVGVQVWHDSPELRREENITIGVVSDAEDGEQAPTAVAERLNADMVVYGTLAPDGQFSALQLQFYLAPQYGADFTNMVGVYQFTQPIPLFNPADPGLEIERPVQALAEMAQGLTYEVVGEPETALAHLQRAGDLLPESDIIHYFIGQELFFLAQRDLANTELVTEAEAAFQQAIEANPENARAQIGLGSVHLLRAQNLLDAAFAEELKGDELAAAMTAVQTEAIAAQSAYAPIAVQPPQLEAYGVPVNHIAQLGQGIAHRILAEVAFEQGDIAQAAREIEQGIAIMETAEAGLDDVQDYRLRAQLYQIMGTLYEWLSFLLVESDPSGSTAARQNAANAYDQCRQQGEQFPFDTYMMEAIIRPLCLPALEALTNQ
jgi:tetratricopeptide (TPR) repeat protein